MLCFCIFANIRILISAAQLFVIFKRVYSLLLTGFVKKNFFLRKKLGPEEGNRGEEANNGN